jgi:hypothetical protein
MIRVCYTVKFLLSCLTVHYSYSAVTKSVCDPRFFVSQWLKITRN